MFIVFVYLSQCFTAKNSYEADCVRVRSSICHFGVLLLFGGRGIPAHIHYTLDGTSLHNPPGSEIVISFRIFIALYKKRVLIEIF